MSDSNQVNNFKLTKATQLAKCGPKNWSTQISTIQVHSKFGEGKESDPNNASVNTLANTPPTRRPTHYRGRHITDASADTLPTSKPTHYRRVGRHITDKDYERRPKQCRLEGYERRQTHYTDAKATNTILCNVSCLLNYYFFTYFSVSKKSEKDRETTT